MGERRREREERERAERRRERRKERREGRDDRGEEGRGREGRGELRPLLRPRLRLRGLPGLGDPPWSRCRFAVAPCLAPLPPARVCLCRRLGWAARPGRGVIGVTNAPAYVGG